MNQSEMITEFVRRCDVDVMMLAGRYTLLEQGALDELLPLAEERGVGIVAAGVYNSGLLSTPRVRRRRPSTTTRRRRASSSNARPRSPRCASGTE